MLLDILLPIRCAACGIPGRSFCVRCRDALIRLAPPLCDRCGSPGAWPVRRAPSAAAGGSPCERRAAIVYDATARRFVHAWKERGQRVLAREAAALVAETLARPRAPVLAYVPSDGDRALTRGHRPAEALARELGKVWELPVSPLVRRARSAERQRGLGLQERRRNVRGAFASARASPARVCLVDDVYTSGATVGAAASALRRGGARRVEVVTFAGGPVSDGLLRWRQPPDGGDAMRLEVKGRNVEVNDSIRRYAEDKLDKLEKQLPEPTQIEVELTLETNPSIADDHIAEGTVWAKGTTLRVRERSAGFETSIDQLADKLERQVKRYREKRSRRETGRRANGAGSDDRPSRARSSSG